MKTRFLEWCKAKGLWRLAQTFFMLIMFSSFFVFFGFKGTNFNIGDGVEITMWEAMTNKTLHILLSKEGITLPYDYHWYNDWLIYLFMVIGVIIDFIFIKFLYKNNQKKKEMEINIEKNKIESERNKDQIKLNEKLMKKLDKIWKD